MRAGTVGATAHARSTRLPACLPPDPTATPPAPHDRRCPHAVRAQHVPQSPRQPGTAAATTTAPPPASALAPRACRNAPKCRRVGTTACCCTGTTHPLCYVSVCCSERQGPMYATALSPLACLFPMASPLDPLGIFVDPSPPAPPPLSPVPWFMLPATGVPASGPPTQRPSWHQPPPCLHRPARRWLATVCLQSASGSACLASPRAAFDLLAHCSTVPRSTVGHARAWRAGQSWAAAQH